jgi:hypothetical protein
VVVGRFCGFEGEGDGDGDGDEEVEAFHRRKRSVAVSFEPNQAAQPPVSRIRVPSCPCQKPLRPWWRKTSRITASGRGAIATVPGAEAGTWILHFTSSTGVRTKLVNAPEMAPVSQRAERGSG